MNKRISIWALTALLAGAAFTACSKDNYGEKDDERPAAEDDRLVTEDGKTSVPEDRLTDEERYLIDCQFAIISTMQSLAGLDEVTPDVADRSFESVYGLALDGEDSYVRSARCEGAEEAEQMFRSIAGLDSVSAVRMLTQTADGCALVLKDLPILPDGKKFSLGMLTFHRESGPARFGYVEVAIPCIPHLNRIDFLSPDAFPDNASASTAYQLGDIVWVTSGSGYCSGYYLCISQYDGRDGLLVHLRDMGGSYAGIGGTETINLDGDRQGCFYPYNRSKGQSTTFDIIKAYARFIVDNQDKVRNIKIFLNGEATSKKPSQAGNLDHIFPGRFDNSAGKVWAPAGAPAAIWYEAEYAEYAWVPAYHYRRGKYAWVGTKGSADASVSDESRKYVYDSDWRDSWNDYSYNYCMNVIRFSTREISGSTLEFSPTKEILKTGIPAGEATAAHLGWCYASDDYLYETADKASSAGFTPLGKVAYISDGSYFGSMVTEEENGGGRGLVIAYNATGSTKRLNQSGVELFTADNGYTAYVSETMGQALRDFGGWEKTQNLSYSGDSPAAEAADGYMSQAYGSGWFIPSTAQWMAMLCSPGLGGAPMPKASDPIGQGLTGDPISKIGIGMGGQVWSSSARNARIGVRLGISSAPTWNWFSNYTGQGYIRPVFAFGPAVAHNAHYEQDKINYEYALTATGGTQRPDGADSYDLLFDGTSAYWYCPDGFRDNGIWWVEFQSAKPGSATAYNLYSWGSAWSANGYEVLYPKNWKLYGKQGQDDAWTLMDERTGEDLSHSAYTAKKFTISSPGAYQYYRLEISETNGLDPNSNWTVPGLILGEFEFLY